MDPAPPPSTGAASPREDDGAALPRVPELDGLRAIAILLVLFSHFVWVPKYWPEAWRGSPFPDEWLSLGHGGVDLFFVLSGFLIGRIIWEHAGSPGFLRTFYLRRAARILPLYYLLLVTGTLLVVLVHRDWQRAEIFGTTPPWAYAVFLQNYFSATGHSVGGFFGLLWSLAIEEQFYLVAPLLVVWLPRRSAMRVALAMLIVCPILRVLMDEEVISGIRWWDFTPARCDALAAGMVVAWLIRAENHRDFLLEQRGRHRFVLCLLALGLACMPWFVSLGGHHLIFSSTGLSVLTLFFAALVGYQALHGSSSRVGSILRFRWLRGLGRISYFLYLFHFVAHHCAYQLRRWLVPASAPDYHWIDVLSGLALLLLAAGLSWRFLEAPLIRWGHRSSYGLREK